MNGEITLERLKKVVDTLHNNVVGMRDNIPKETGNSHILDTPQNVQYFKDYPFLTGVKNDDGKLPMHLLSVPALTGLAQVLQYGASKYAERNWEKGMDYSRCYSALFRHLTAWWEGEDFDRETGLSHMDHVAANAMFLSDYIKTGRGNDNRPNTPQEVKF